MINAAQFLALVNNPTLINDLSHNDLEKIVTIFPYFQSARALQLKYLFAQNSYNYNIELRKTAAYTADRSILFDFISSESFLQTQKSSPEYEEKILKSENNIQDKTVEQADINREQTNEHTVTKIVQSIKESIAESDMQTFIHDIEFVKKDAIKHDLEIGKPLDFNKKEKFSFHEWLQLSEVLPLNRTSEPPKVERKPVENKESKKRNQAIIDKFIETNPKITPIKNYTPSINIDKSTEDNSHIMTETLAKVYLEQKKYQKAIQAYEILILKYPEKFSFFANRIAEIKNLQ